MPHRLLEQFAEQVPHFLAAETLRMYNAIALGSGGMKRGERSTMLRSLEREAFGKSQPVYKAKDAEEHRMLLASVGIVMEE